MMNPVWKGLIASLTVLIASCTGEVPDTSRPTPEEGIVVETQLGRVAGRVDPETGTHIFLGIPFAQPPVGDLRFKPPVPVQPWEGVLDATEFGPASAQIYDEETASLEDFGVEPTEEPVNDVQ